MDRSNSLANDDGVAVYLSKDEVEIIEIALSIAADRESLELLNDFNAIRKAVKK